MKKIEFTKEERDLIVSKCFPANTSEVDIKYGISVAEALGLNPLIGEITFVKRSMKVKDTWISKVQPLVNRDGYLAIAHATGQFDGMETVTEVKQVSKMVKDKWEKIDDLVATTTVYRKDTSHPFVVSVNFSEYVQKNNQGEVTSFWKTKPRTMLSKVAESQALRRAFNISGVYSPEELAQDLDISSSMEAQTQAIEPLASEAETPKIENKVSKPKEKKNTLSEIAESLKVIGLTLKEDGTVDGKTYGKGQQLKALGFKWNPANKVWYLPNTPSSAAA